MPQPEKTAEKTHFGYETVTAQEKTARVGAVFSSVARRYDVMNDVMSAGLHRRWKDVMVQKIALSEGMHILDVAGGTGDIAFRLLKRAEQREKNISVTVCDINPDMLQEGRARALDRGIIRGIDWQEGNAEQLPFPDSSMDAYTIAFGMRNVTHIDRALQEARRVLKPGGQFCCLEFSHVEQPTLKRLYDAYSFGVIPRMGALVGRDRAAYQYLAESIRMFPTAGDYAGMITAAGLSQVRYEQWMGGIVALHTAWRV